jgi:hypothetical protein
VAAFQSRTREQIRRSIAANLDQSPASSATSGGSTTTLVDANYIGGDDEFNGGWLVFTSGTNDGLIRRVTDYASSSGTFTFKPAATASTASSDTYEYWRAEYPPERIHEFINQAIIQRTPRGLVSDEDESNHGHALDSRHNVPSSMVAVYSVDYRSSFSGKQVDLAKTTWTEGSGGTGSVTATTDSEDWKAHGASSSFYLDAVTADTVGYKDISVLNLARNDTLEFWFKSSVTHAAGDLTIVLSSASALGSAKETINIPAATARTWTYMRVSLANPETDTAITSVGIKYAAGTATTRYVWINDIKAVDSESATYTRLWGGNYRIDKESRKIFLTEPARGKVGYSLVRLSGYRLPVLLSADATVCETDPDLVVARATSRSLFSLARGRTTDPDDNDRRAAFFEGVAAQAERSLPAIKPGTKMVD